jgi:hypothetical protein
MVLVAAALASSAYADKPPSNPGSGSSNAGGRSKPTDPGAGTSSSALPGPDAALPAKAKAYGRYCQSQSRLHVAGRPGTPFSQCVTAMAKLATRRTKDPWTACSALSRKHVQGAAGSPFGRCVVAGTRLLNDLRKP